MLRRSLLIMTIAICCSCSPAESPSLQSKSPQSKSAPDAMSEGDKHAEIPIYVTPYYNSQGPRIEVGEYSEDLARLTAENADDLAARMKENWATLPVEAMYVMSIRLYDVGRKDDAVYWYYSAQFRSKLFRSVLAEESVGGVGSAPFEISQAQVSFQMLAGQFINGYAFGDLPKLQATIRRVLTESESIPRFEEMYSNQQLIDEKAWPKKREEVAAGLKKLLDHIENNADEIKQMRKENGIEGKY